MLKSHSKTKDPAYAVCARQPITAEVTDRSLLLSDFEIAKAAVMRPPFPSIHHNFTTFLLHVFWRSPGASALR